MQIASDPFLFSTPIVAMASGMATLALLVVLPLSIYYLVRGYELVQKYLKIAHTPTSDCGGVMPGGCEINAEIADEETMASPLTDEPVVYYDYSVEKVGPQGADDTDQEIASRSKRTAFYVHDDTGRVRVDPRGAEIHPNEALNRICSSRSELFQRGPSPESAAPTERRRFRERNLTAGENVYIIGTVRDRQGLGVPEMSAGSADDPFIISAYDESELVDRYASEARNRLITSAAGFTAIPVLVAMSLMGVGFGEAFEMTLLPTFMIAVGAGVLVWGLYRMSHHSHLQDLKERMSRAEKILQRETRHRERLLTQVAERIGGAVDGYGQRRIEDAFDHRFTPSRRMTTSQIAATVDGQSDVLEVLFSVAQGIEGLDDDAEFRELLEELTRCEKQLMMGRNFYNEGSRRLAGEPEGRIGEYGAKGAKLSFQPFERKPVEIVLAEDPDDEYGDEQLRSEGDETAERSGEQYMGMSPDELADDGEPNDSADSSDAADSEVPPVPSEDIDRAAMSDTVDSTGPPEVPQQVAKAGPKPDDGASTQPEDAEARQSDEGSSVPDFDELDTDSLAAESVGDADWTSGSSMKFGERDPFGDVPSFDDVTSSDGQSLTMDRDFGFDDGDFGGAGKLSNYGGYGFESDEKASLDDDDGFRGYGDIELKRDYGFDDDDKRGDKAS